MFGFVMVLAYPDAEENEFICSQWERKECIQMFIALVSATWDPCQMSFILL
jgi:hypothetical protein